MISNFLPLSRAAIWLWAVALLALGIGLVAVLGPSGTSILGAVLLVFAGAFATFLGRVTRAIGHLRRAAVDARRGYSGAARSDRLQRVRNFFPDGSQLQTYRWSAFGALFVFVAAAGIATSQAAGTWWEGAVAGLIVVAAAYSGWLIGSAARSSADQEWEF